MPTETTQASAAPALVLGSSSPYRRELLARLRQRRLAYAAP